MRQHPNRSVVSRRASREVIPEAEQRSPPRRMPSRRSIPGHDSRPPFRPSARSRVPTMPSADVGGAVREDPSALSPVTDTPQISRGQRSYRRCRDAGCITYAPAVDGGLRGGVPTRPERTTPHIRFVSLAPHLRSTRPSDPTSRGRPCASLVLRLHAHLDRGLSPPSITACTAHTLAMSCGAERRQLHGSVSRLTLARAIRTPSRD